MLETRSYVTSTKNGLFDQLLSSIESLEGEGGDYSKYQSDPVAFGEEVLGETYTSEVRIMMESVRDNDITIAKSANATGKTHGAARVAVWWYKAFPNSQVYTAAAPPESNLKKLLWGEVGSITEKHPELFKSDTLTNLHVQRAAQSFLTGVTIPSSGTEAQREAKFSGKHAPHLLFIIDERDAVPDEVYRGRDQLSAQWLTPLESVPGLPPRCKGMDVLRLGLRWLLPPLKRQSWVSLRYFEINSGGRAGNGCAVIPRQCCHLMSS